MNHATCYSLKSFRGDGEGKRVASVVRVKVTGRVLWHACACTYIRTERTCTFRHSNLCRREREWRSKFKYTRVRPERGRCKQREIRPLAADVICSQTFFPSFSLFFPPPFFSFHGCGLYEYTNMLEEVSRGLTRNYITITATTVISPLVLRALVSKVLLSPLLYRHFVCFSEKYIYVHMYVICIGLVIINFLTLSNRPSLIVVCPWRLVYHLPCALLDERELWAF